MIRGNLDNVIYASLALLALVIFYALLVAHGAPENQALGFSLLGACILTLVLFTLRIGKKDRDRHPDH